MKLINNAAMAADAARKVIYSRRLNICNDSLNGDKSLYNIMTQIFLQ